MDAPDPTDASAPLVSRRRLLRGVGIGAGLATLGRPFHLLSPWSDGPTDTGTQHGPHDLAGGAFTDASVPSSQPLTGTLAGHSRVGPVLVPAGARLRFDPSRDTTLEVSGNLVVRGRLVMRPEPGVQHVLRFVDVDESAFVGGGLDVLDTDAGLWVMGDGVLDIKGTTRDAWNRRGDSRTWKRSDDLIVAPVRAGDFDPKPFTKGHRVPRSGRYRAEVLNLTRNVRIEGTPGGRAHIFIRSTKPQSIRYATLRHLGPRQPGGETTESVLGRYGLHFHHCHGGSRGSIVEGVVVRDCGGHAFVPHMSHGITIRSCIAYDVLDEAYWWDPHDKTNDLLIDRCVAAAVHHDPDVHGHRLAGFFLGDGRRLRIRRSVAFAVHGNATAAGYVWPEAPSGLWVFEDNVAHNNVVAGIFVWQNNREPHAIDRFTAFRNGEAGIIHGAYVNAYHYRKLDLRQQTNAIRLHAAARRDPSGRSQSWIDVKGGSLEVLEHNLAGESPTLFRGCSFPGGVTIDDAQGEKGPLDFVNCGLRRGDFRIESMHPATVVRVQRANRTAFELTSSGVRSIRPFYPY